MGMARLVARSALLAAGAVPLWVVAAPPPAPAAPPSSMLTAGAHASRVTNFEGVLLYRGANTMEVLRVIHRYRDGSESEHLITLTGEPRELIRQGDRLTCILPRDHRLSLQRPSMKSFLNRLDGPTIHRLTQWYEFESLGTSRVAGRDCIGVAVKPRDAYRYGYEVWLDQKTDLPLRVVLMGNGRRVLEQVMFTAIRFPKSIPDSAFAPKVAPSSQYKVVTQQLSHQEPVVDAANSASERWHFTALPPGFKVTMRDKRTMPDGVGRVDHILVSDGLSAVSVFSARADSADKGFHGLSRMGAVHAYGRSLDGYHITVVGEAPSRTVQMIGDSIRPVSAAAVASSANVGAAADSDGAPVSAPSAPAAASSIH